MNIFNNFKRQDIFAYIASGLFLIKAITFFVMFFTNKIGTGAIISYIIQPIILAFIAIFLFLRKQNLGLVISTGAFAVWEIIYILYSYTTMFEGIYLFLAWKYFLNTLVFVAANIILFLSCLILVLPSMQKHVRKVKILALIPSVLYLLYDLFNFIFNGLNNDIFLILLIPLAVLFMGLWLSFSVPITYKELFITDPKLKKQEQSIIDEADALLQYKELLDLGIITQEEFDIKKQEILH